MSGGGTHVGMDTGIKVKVSSRRDILISIILFLKKKRGNQGPMDGLTINAANLLMMN